MSIRHEDDPYYAPGVASEGDSLYVGPEETDVGNPLLREPYPVGASLGSHVWVTGAAGHGVWQSVLESGNGFVPTLIDVGETFVVPVNRQALYAISIVCDGDIIINGDLVMVD